MPMVAPTALGALMLALVGPAPYALAFCAVIVALNGLVRRGQRPSLVNGALVAATLAVAAVASVSIQQFALHAPGNPPYWAVSLVSWLALAAPICMAGALRQWLYLGVSSFVITAALALLSHDGVEDAFLVLSPCIAVPLAVLQLKYRLD